MMNPFVREKHASRVVSFREKPCAGLFQVRAIIFARIINCTVLSRARRAADNEASSTSHSRTKSPVRAGSIGAISLESLFLRRAAREIRTVVLSTAQFFDG